VAFRVVTECTLVGEYKCVSFIMMVPGAVGSKFLRNVNIELQGYMLKKSVNENLDYHHAENIKICLLSF
jgi:hypothetical protein